MKLILVLSCILASNLLADENTEMKILKLEKRIKDLEQSKQTKTDSGIKTEDHANGSSTEKIDPKLESKRQELLKELKKYKKYREENQKVLDEIMESDA